MRKIAPIASPVMPLPSRESEDIFYLDVLRAKYGSEVYPLDRFVEVFKIEDNVWALRQTSPAKIIDGNWAYLIEGPERAALIDNSYGIGDLKGLCEFLVGVKRF